MRLHTDRLYPAGLDNFLLVLFSGGVNRARATPLMWRKMPQRKR